MRYIVIEVYSNKVKSVSDLTFEYEYPLEHGYKLVTGYEDLIFNLMTKDYYYSNSNFIEVNRL